MRGFASTFLALPTALLLLALPGKTQAQVEIGFDAGLTIISIDDVRHDVTEIDIPDPTVRLGFPINESLIFEPLFSFHRESMDDASRSTLLLVPGVVFLVGEGGEEATRFYVRGEGGIHRESWSNGSDDSRTQFGLGGGAGLRSPLGESGLLRAEAGFDVFFEKSDHGSVTARGFKVFRLRVGVSQIID